MQQPSVSFASRYGTQILLAVRITVASLLAYVLSRLVGLTQGYPAVVTSVIVMQGSLGASLKAMFDRFVGSLGGAIWGVLVLMAFGHSSTVMLGVTLAVAVAPLALLIALKPAYRPAPITAIILIFTPVTEAIPLTPAIHRMLGIGLGSIVALAVALVVFPSRAHGTLLEAASKALQTMSDLVKILMKTPSAPVERESAQKLHDQLRKSLALADSAADAVVQERMAYLTGAADGQSLCRTLRRIYHDLAMIGRATIEPLPEPFQSQLSERTAATSEAIAAFFKEIGDAIARRAPAPSLAVVEAALVQRDAAIAELRKGGHTRELPVDSVGRIFGLGFALEQLHRNMLDLCDRANENKEISG
jgi:uncharacterized membrane protein YccC